MDDIRILPPQSLHVNHIEKKPHINIFSKITYLLGKYRKFSNKTKESSSTISEAMLPPLINRAHYRLSHINLLMKSRSDFIAIIICLLAFLSALSLQADTITCRTCGGSGRLHNGYTSSSMTCTTCSGSGREYSTPTYPYTSGGYRQCPTCKGYRSIRLNGYEQVCPKCGGAGEITSGNIPGFPGGGYITVPGLPPIPVSPQPSFPGNGSTIATPEIPDSSKSSTGEIVVLPLIAIGCTLGAIFYVILIIFINQLSLNKTNRKPTDVKTLSKQTIEVISTHISNILCKIKERINKAKQSTDNNQNNSQRPPFLFK